MACCVSSLRVQSSAIELLFIDRRFADQKIEKLGDTDTQRSWDAIAWRHQHIAQPAQRRILLLREEMGHRVGRLIRDRDVQFRRLLCHPCLRRGGRSLLRKKRRSGWRSNQCSDKLPAFHRSIIVDLCDQKMSFTAICIVRLPLSLVTIPNVAGLFTVVPGPPQVGEFVKL